MQIEEVEKSVYIDRPNAEEEDEFEATKASHIYYIKMRDRMNNVFLDESYLSETRK